MAVGTATAVLGGASLLGSYFSSKATSKQASKQAEAIKQAQGISAEATRKAVSAMFDIYNPAMAAFNESMAGSIDLVNQGRMSSSQLINQGYQNASQIMAQGGQNAMAALLGVPAQQLASPQVMQQISNTMPNVPAATEITNSGLLPPRAETSEYGGLKPPRQDVIPASAATDGGLGGMNRNQGLGANPSLSGNYAPSTPTGMESSPSNNYGTPSQRFADTLTPTQAPQLTQVQQPQFTPQALNMPQSNVGIAGAEQAIQSGAGLGQQAMIQGAGAGLGALSERFNQASNTRLAGGEFGLNQIQQAMNASNQGFGQGVNTIQQGAQAGANAAMAGAQQGVGFLQPYMNTGAAVQDRLLALSGNQGQEAFDNALLNDPAYKYALQQSERALGRNAAVTGMTGSGNVMQQYLDNAQLQAAADIDRQFGRSFNLSEAGRGAASTAGGFTTSAGQAAGNMLASGAQAAGGLQAQQGQSEAGLRQAMASIGINTAQDLSAYAAQMGMTENQVLNQLGQNIGNINVNTGNTLGGMRYQGGLAAADIINQNAMNQGQLMTGQANNLAGLDQQSIANIINSIQQGAGTQLGTATNFAGQLANAYTGQGNQAVQLQQNLGQAQAAGVTNPWGNAINTGLGLYASGVFNKQGLGNNNSNNFAGNISRPGDGIGPY